MPPFLELDIKIEDDTFKYKLYDKRDAFPFHIVRMPDASGNLLHHVSFGSILSELPRIARATLNYDDFLDKAKDLVRRMLRQGGEMAKITKLINKINIRHSNALFSFDKSTIEIKQVLSNV